MTSKERVKATFSRSKTDRPALWCGASPEFMDKAMRELNLPDHEALLRRFHDDFRRVHSRYIGPSEFDPAHNALQGRSVTVFGVERHGIGYGLPDRAPLENATIEEVHAYPWPSADWYDVSHIRDDCLAYGDEYAIMGGEWCAFFHDAVDLLGMENMFILMYEEPEIVHAVLGHIVDFYYEICRRTFESAADAMDIFFIGNDFGSQNGPMLGKELFDVFIKPHIKRLCALGHEYGLKVQLHCCGSFNPLMESMIDAGVDALQSLQPITPDMQADVLKRDFADRIIINGCVDSVPYLIQGTPDEVRDETNRVLSIMMPNMETSGFILSASHDYILEETPVENVLAMFDAGYVWTK